MADVTSQGVLSAIARKNAGGAISISDNFNRANAELSTSPSSEGWSWINADVDNMNIVTNAVEVPANDAAFYYANFSLGTPDMEVQITVTNEYLASTSAVGARARWTDKDNHYYINRSHNTNDFRLYKTVTGTQTQIGTAYTADPTPPYTMKIVVDGDQISGYVNGTLRIGPVTDTSITTGNYAGISAYSNGSKILRIDDFSATAL